MLSLELTSWYCNCRWFANCCRKNHWWKHLHIIIMHDAEWTFFSLEGITRYRFKIDWPRYSHTYCSILGKHPLPGKCPCIEFQGITVAASIQTYGIYIPYKCPCGLKLRVMFKRSWTLTWDIMVVTKGRQKGQNIFFGIFSCLYSMTIKLCIHLCFFRLHLPQQCFITLSANQQHDRITHSVQLMDPLNICLHLLKGFLSLMNHLT